MIYNCLKEEYSDIGKLNSDDEFQGFIKDEAEALSKGNLSYCFTEEQEDTLKNMFSEGDEFISKIVDEDIILLIPKFLNCLAKKELISMEVNNT